MERSYLAMLRVGDLSPRARLLWLQEQAELAGQRRENYADYSQQICSCGRPARGHPQRETGQRYCRRCFWRVVRAIQADNRARGLCDCGREKDYGRATCVLCRERKTARMRRYRGRLRLAAWDRNRQLGPGAEPGPARPPWLDLFLAVLEDFESGKIAAAARRVGVSRSAVYRALAAFPDFAFEVEAIREEAAWHRWVARRSRS